MFEDQEQSPTQSAKVPESNSTPLPSKVAEDMLAEVDTNPVRPLASQPADLLDGTSPREQVRSYSTATSNMSDGIPEEYLDSKSGMTVKVIAVVATLVILAGGAGAWWYLRPSTTTPEQTSEEGSPVDDVTNAEVNPRPDLQLQGEGPSSPEDDSDQDGLSNEQELQAGTDPQNPDTDGDGLFDGEEVRSFGTDPLKADTDGDTFSDGSEVRNGYNPKGLGKLFNVPQ